MKATYTGGTPHRIRHLLVTPQGLYPKSYSLQLCAHLIELLDVAACSDKVFRHHFACVLHES